MPFFFFNVTAPTEIYTLSLHDALPIYALKAPIRRVTAPHTPVPFAPSLEKLYIPSPDKIDRKSTRLNSSHPSISYAVFCLKKKKKKNQKLKQILKITVSTNIST